jgi:Rrf2 family protein
MKLSTRSRYGVRMMYELAMNYEKEPVIIKDIASRQDISEKYLSKLIIPLKGARLVNSARGSHGGYMLARDPSMITLREIVEILEGDITPVECVKNARVCDRSKNCPTRDIWCRLDKSISGFLDGITLKELMKNGDDTADEPSSCI